MRDKSSSSSSSNSDFVAPGGSAVALDTKADPFDAQMPLRESELDELERRLETDDPVIRQHTRAWSLVAIRQLRAALVRLPREQNENIDTRVAPLKAGADGQDLPRTDERE